MSRTSLPEDRARLRTLQLVSDFRTLECLVQRHPERWVCHRVNRLEGHGFAALEKLLPFRCETFRVSALRARSWWNRSAGIPSAEPEVRDESIEAEKVVVDRQHLEVRETCVVGETLHGRGPENGAERGRRLFGA